MEKIIKDNKWNRIFHKKQIIKQTELYDKYQIMDRASRELLQKISEAECLIQLMDCHKEAWKVGYKNDNLAPCKYGIFRTKDILSMTGFGIDHSIKIYFLIMGQYRKLLSSNIRVMRDEVRDYIVRYNLINPSKDPTKVW